MPCEWRDSWIITQLYVEFWGLGKQQRVILTLPSPGLFTISEGGVNSCFWKTCAFLFVFPRKPSFWFLVWNQAGRIWEWGKPFPQSKKEKNGHCSPAVCVCAVAHVLLVAHLNTSHLGPRLHVERSKAHGPAGDTLVLDVEWWHGQGYGTGGRAPWTSLMISWCFRGKVGGLEVVCTKNVLSWSKQSNLECVLLGNLGRPMEEVTQGSTCLVIKPLIRQLQQHCCTSKCKYLQVWRQLGWL